MSQRTVIGRVGGITPRVAAQLVRPASATQYAANDHIANNGTGADVTPMSFDLSEIGASCSGLIYGARCTLKAASGAVVTTALAFDLMLFRPVDDVPYAAGSYPADNAALTLTSTAMKQCVARVGFTSSGWVSGGFETGAAWQTAVLSSGLTAEPFSLQGLGAAATLVGIVKATDAWNPGNVAQTLDFELIVQGD